MVDLSRDKHEKTRAGLLDLVPGRSGKAYATWLAERGEPFRDGVEVAALDPFSGYKTAIDDQLDDAVAVLDAFHVVKLGTQVVDEVRRRVQRDTSGIAVTMEIPSTACRPSSARRREPHGETARPARCSDRSRPAHDEVFVACARRNSDPRTTPPTSPRVGGSRTRSPTRFTHAPSRKSRALGARCDDGGQRSWPTSPRTGHPTAAPKRSTESLSRTAASPPAPATETTTGSECSSPPEAAPHDPHRTSQEPTNRSPRRVELVSDPHRVGDPSPCPIPSYAELACRTWAGCE